MLHKLFIRVIPLLALVVHAQQQCPSEVYDDIEFQCDIEQLQAPFYSIVAGVGWVSASIEEWPYITSLQIPVFEKGVGCYYHLCGGALISPNLVISAAHCFDQIVANNIPMLDIFASLAPRCRHLGSTRGFQGQRFQVQYIEIAPSWDSETAIGDLAILVLNQSLPGPYVKLNRDFSVPSPTTKNNPKMSVAGWGAINPQEIPNKTEIILGTQQYNLRQLYQDSIYEVGEELCKKFLSLFDTIVENPFYVNSENMFDVETMICARAIGGESDTCQGDSGSPLVIKGDVLEDDVLAGVVSWGPRNQCNSLEHYAPGIFTRVSAFAEWIDEIVLQYSS